MKLKMLSISSLSNTLSLSNPLTVSSFFLVPSSSPSSSQRFPFTYQLQFRKTLNHHLSFSLSSRKTSLLSKPSDSDAQVSATEEEDEWLSKLPDKKKPLYAHSLPCIEAWLRKLGFYQSKEDRTVWFIEKPDWHAQLSLDITDLYIRYLKSGPGNLEKDVERRFSYALSREDIENAVLGGP